MDFRNKSILEHKVTSTDVNKAIQRATAKAIAMHGLGLTLWTGEDIPSQPTKEVDTRGTKKLAVGSEDWVKVEKYVKSRKWKNITEVTNVIGGKYEINATITEELIKLI